MTLTAHGAGAVAALSFTLPALGFALGPRLRAPRRCRWEAVGPPDDFPNDTYIPKVITPSPGIGEAGKTTVYMRARNDEIDTEPNPPSTTRVHRDLDALHAPRLPGPLREAPQRFICPCHGGVYDFAASSTAGRRCGRSTASTPACATARSRSARASRSTASSSASPTTAIPAQPLDGIGQYLYPPRFSTPLQ